LQNFALSPGTVIDEHAFCKCTDLLQVFQSETKMTKALQRRFDGLPVQETCYNQSFRPVTTEVLNDLMKMKIDPSGKHQDCLGMTPLHILACSTVHSLEVYQFMIEVYPQNLITEDAWGVPPFLYVLPGNTHRDCSVSHHKLSIDLP
jgi:hypothetical protein